MYAVWIRFDQNSGLWGVQVSKFCAEKTPPPSPTRVLNKNSYCMWTRPFQTSQKIITTDVNDFCICSRVGLYSTPFSPTMTLTLLQFPSKSSTICNVVYCWGDEAFWLNHTKVLHLLEYQSSKTNISIKKESPPSQSTARHCLSTVSLSFLDNAHLGSLLQANLPLRSFWQAPISLSNKRWGITNELKGSSRFRPLSLREVLTSSSPSELPNSSQAILIK